MDVRETNPTDRRWFLLALGVYLAWVVALGVLAVVSGQKPVERPVAEAR
ncbi:MAG: hypothetical protein AB7I30_17635 [Isosphaeraceae bacterium]